MPTLPLLSGTFLTSQSMVSYVSELSSTSCGPRLFGDLRAHVDELAFRHVAAAHVLVDEDEVLPWRTSRRARGRSCKRPRRTDATLYGVRIEHDRDTSASVLRHVDGGEEALAVAHRNAVLVLGVVGLDVFEALPEAGRHK